jgi:4-methyl-5(b-hydroxyethyl)-thiazole monophosphate biosynthesis
MTKVLIPLADGVEEMEAVIPIDIFRRAGWEVVSAGMTGQTVNASRGVRLVADMLWDDIDPSTFNILLLPGGAKGSAFLASSPGILAAVRDFVRAGKIVAAVCAAPLALQAAGVLDGKKATCHPGVTAQMKTPVLCEDPVVVDGNIVTSRGAGTCFEFALTIVRLVDGCSKADSIASAIVL